MSSDEFFTQHAKYSAKWLINTRSPRETGMIIAFTSAIGSQRKTNKNTLDYILKYFSDLFQKTGFDISCKHSPKETA